MPERRQPTASRKFDESDEVNSLNHTILQLQRKAEMRRIMNQRVQKSKVSLREEFFEGLKIAK